MPDIKQAKILIMATDGFEQSELMVPQEKLSKAGATVEVAAPKSRMKSGKIYGWDENDWGKTVSVDKDIEDVDQPQSGRPRCLRGQDHRGGARGLPCGPARSGGVSFLDL
jgi:hypothetical protein